MCDIVSYVRFVKIVLISLQFYTQQEDTGVKNTGLVFWRWLDLLKLCKQIYDSIHNKETMARNFNVYRFAKIVETSLQFWQDGDTMARWTLDFHKLWILKIQIKYANLFWTNLKL